MIPALWTSESNRITEMEKTGAGDSCKETPNNSTVKKFWSRKGTKNAMNSVNPTAREATEPEKVTKKLDQPERKPTRGP